MATAHGYENIQDRTDGTGTDAEFYIVTGSIGPHFTPRTYDTYTKAWQEARKICLYGKRNDVWPAFAPCIEGRNEAVR